MTLYPVLFSDTYNIDTCTDDPNTPIHYLERANLLKKYTSMCFDNETYSFMYYFSKFKLELDLFMDIVNLYPISSRDIEVGEMYLAYRLWNHEKKLVLITDKEDSSHSSQSSSFPRSPQSPLLPLSYTSDESWTDKRLHEFGLPSIIRARQPIKVIETQTLQPLEFFELYLYQKWSS